MVWYYVLHVCNIMRDLLYCKLAKHMTVLLSLSHGETFPGRVQKNWSFPSLCSRKIACVCWARNNKICNFLPDIKPCNFAPLARVLSGALWFGFCKRISFSKCITTATFHLPRWLNANWTDKKQFGSGMKSSAVLKAMYGCVMLK